MGLIVTEERRGSEVSVSPWGEEGLCENNLLSMAEVFEGFDVGVEFIVNGAQNRVAGAVKADD
ncbi:hypothetical protein GGH91_003642, partial [Coemansia sp. RSA 2671]